MGKRNKTFKNKGRGGEQGQGVRGNYDAIPTENAAYEKYYRESGLIDSSEWDRFWGTLKKTLPTTFRFTGSKGHALSTMKTLQDVHVPHLKGVVWDGELVDAPTPIPWYPDNLAWQTTVGKSTIRRCPPFKKFQNFLVNETTVGNISRQEAVSMIPPLLMDVEPHHAVLDMCAAPGSKTAQLIEALHMGEEAAVGVAAISSPGDPAGVEGDLGGRPTGLVMANDSDYRRSHMLVHQTKRLNSPNIIVTNHDATAFPSILTTPPTAEKKGEYLKFDRILADVPCTGDGTTRKNYSVWRDWTPHGAMNLHMIQQRILVRGLQMLKVGGRIVYSTCSMNPIENEAVVAAAIDRCGGVEKVQIVDCSDRLPELKRRAGLKGGWRVMDKDQVWYNTWEEVVADTPGREARMSRITQTMFPTEGGKDDTDPTRIPLERCLRVYPHLQDTGGFFITVLEKKQEIRQIKEEASGRRKLAAIARAKQRQERNAMSEADQGIETPTDGATPLDAAADDFTAAEPMPTEMEGVAPTSTAEEEARAITPPPPSSPTKRKLESPAPASTPPAVKKIKQDTTVAEPAPSSDVVAKKKGGGPPSEEPFKYLPPDHAVLQQIYAFYNLSPRFPRNCFMVRNAEGVPSRAIYFTTQLARHVLQANEGKGVRFVHCGVKAFMKQDVQSAEVCPWRIQNEGLSIVAPWIGEERVVRASKKETLHGLLKELFPKVNEEGQGASTHGIEEIEHRARELGMGCCVLKVHSGEAEEECDEDMVLPLWKSRHSCNLMLPKDERRAMLMRIFNDDSEPVDSTKRNSHHHRDAVAAAAASTTEPLPSAGTHVRAPLSDTEAVAGEPSKDGISFLDPSADADPEKMQGVDDQPAVDVDPLTGAPAGTADQGAVFVPATAQAGVKVPTEQQLEEEVAREEVEKTEERIKRDVVEGADL